MALCDTSLQFPAIFTNSVKELSALSMEEWDMSLHDKLVAHTHTVTDDLEGRSGVWGEHSYARERGAAPHPHVRALLTPRARPAPPAAPPSPGVVDVDTPPPAAPAPPLDEPSDTDSDAAAADAADAADADWEQSLLGAAPSGAHRRLALAAIDILREMRLRRLAAPRSRWERQESARAAATRLRRALAAHWAGGAAGWLHGALLAALPRRLRALYARAAAELRRAAPRLAARLAPRPEPPRADPLAAAPPPLPADAPGPWLGWVSAGCERLDARWRSRLAALLHVRPLPAAAAPAPAPPERWCAARAHAARSALAQLLQEAGSRPVVLGGCGAGAALAAWLARGGGAGRVRALLLLAPPLLTAEGPDDPLHAVDVPTLLVAGAAAAQSGRGGAGAAAAGGGRRLLLVGGADDALRLPRRHRLRLRVPQSALDAAIADECARWASDVTESSDASAPSDVSGVSALSGVSAPREDAAAGGVSADRSRTKRSERAPSIVPDAPPFAPAAPPVAPAAAGSGNRTIEIVEGCVVSRVSGGTPLALGPPRRAELQPADIMRLPIVFADDHAAPPPAAPAPPPPPPLARITAQETSVNASRLTVRAGGHAAGRAGGHAGGRAGGHAGGRSGRAPVRYTRVIVAKRGGSAPLVVRRRHGPADPADPADPPDPTGPSGDTANHAAV